MRYFVYLAFNGTAYHGSQIQPNNVSVQEVMQEAFSRLLRTPIELVFSSRTDAGVHAKMMVAHLDYVDDWDVSDFMYHINHFLPKDITINKIVQVIPTVHARFDAVKRTYQYHIIRHKDPFLFPLTTFIDYPIDTEKMNACCDLLLGKHDFACFAKKHSDAKTTICTITEAFWEQKDNQIVFTISADRFLRNMVRAIVGTLLLVGKNKLSQADFTAILEQKNRSLAGESAPAKGLFLTDIQYPSDIFLPC